MGNTAGNRAQMQTHLLSALPEPAIRAKHTWGG